MKPTFFSNPKELRAWYEANHDRLSALVIGFHKKATGKESLTYQEALDEALAHGWIDGIRRSLGEESYTIRYTPRRKTSIWSQVNMRRVAELEAAGRMHPAGVRAFEERDPRRQNQYSSENRHKGLEKNYEDELRSNDKAWAFFEQQPPSYRHTAGFWVMSAKQEATRHRRLRTLISDSEKGMRIKPLTSPRDREKYRKAESEEAE
jgi:uncharacterized protein YdeI (YjbR/CyaY-like superfamily)